MKLVAVAAAALAMSGCSMFMHSIEQPKATVQSVSLSSAGWTGITGKLDLDVMNPNNFSVPLSGIDWTLSVNGARAISGRVELSQNIPARGNAPVSTSLTLDARDAIAVGSSLASGGRTYRLDARLHFSTGFSKVDVAISQEGQLGG
jgi:LEA14-like dessication related protein